MNESLSRVFSQCQAIAARRQDVLCDMGRASLHVCRPDAAMWIEVEAAMAVGGTEQIRVTEYRPGSYQQHTTCCAWEAGTLIEQLLDGRKR
jgi:hypothetical protein